MAVFVATENGKEYKLPLPCSFYRISENRGRVVVEFILLSIPEDEPMADHCVYIASDSSYDGAIRKIKSIEDDFDLFIDRHKLGNMLDMLDIPENDFS